MKSLAIVLLSLPLMACAASPADQCSTFLGSIQAKSEYKLDLVEIAGFPENAPILDFLSRQRITTPCVGLGKAGSEFPIATGRSTKPWILFVSKAEDVVSGEMLEGAAGNLVFYKDGEPTESRLVAKLVTEEGFGLSRSARVLNDHIEICDQEVEFFQYTEEGDIVGLLDEPERKQCKVERIPIR